MPIVQFERGHLVPTAWKNGGGRTLEIVRMPKGSDMDTFEWRASIAEISADGPFSTFVGVDRVLVLLSGDGARLRSRDGKIDHRLVEPLKPFVFAGETPIEASLIGGPSSDFNMMTRRSTTRADVCVVTGRRTLSACSSGVLFAAQGSWDVRSIENESRSFALETNSGLWWNNELLAWEFTPRAATDALIAVRATRRISATKAG